MSDAIPPPIASGDLARTPFAHLILYLYQHRSSGTLVVYARDGEHKTLFHRGRAVAASAPLLMAALDDTLVPLSALSAAAFEFHAADLVGSGPDVVTGTFDPLAFVIRVARLYAREPTITPVLAKYASAALGLDPSMDPSRLSLTPQELQLLSSLKAGPLGCDELIGQSGMPREAARRLLYSLLITGALRPERASPSANPGGGAAAGRLSTPSFAPRPSRPFGARTSSDAWRAIASAAGAIAEGRSASDPGGLLARGSRPSVPLASPQSQRPRSQSHSQALGPREGEADGRSASRSISRPLSQSFGGPSRDRSSDSRSVRSGARDSTRASGSGSSTPMPRSTPRPSLPDVNTLDADGKFRRVELLCQRNAFHEALPIMRGLLEQERKNAKYLGMLSHVLLGRTSDANFGKELVDCVNQALRIDPDEVHALYTKARCYKRLGKEREALHYFRRTLAVEPTHLDAAREARLLVSRLSDKRKR